MSNTDNNRVLTRMGARTLSKDELDEISAGVIPTRLTVLVTGATGNPDQSPDT